MQKHYYKLDHGEGQKTVDDQNNYLLPIVGEPHVKLDSGGRLVGKLILIDDPLDRKRCDNSRDRKMRIIEIHSAFK